MPSFLGNVLCFLKQLSLKKTQKNENQTSNQKKKNPKTQNSLYVFWNYIRYPYQPNLHQNPKDLQRHKEKSTFDWPLAH